MPRRRPSRRTGRAPGDRVRPATPPTPPTPPARPGRDPVLLATVLAVLGVLALAGDDRHVGQIADGRQMIRTAVALAETGEIGQARGRDFTIERPSGDAVSRFGMATSLLQVPAAWLAPRVEARLGPGASQALFLIVPWLAVGLGGRRGRCDRAPPGRRRSRGRPRRCCWPRSPRRSASYATARVLRAGAGGRPGSRSRGRARRGASAGPAPGLEVAAGFAAGFAVLAKSSLIVAAPLALLPLLDRERPRAHAPARCSGTAAGALPPLALWVFFRGRFASAGSSAATRTTASPIPGSTVSGASWSGPTGASCSSGRRSCSSSGRGFGRSARVARDAGGAGLARRRLGARGAAGGRGGLLGLARHGGLGTSPRRRRRSRCWRRSRRWPPARGRRPLLVGCVALGLFLNLPPLLQHPTPVATYVMNLAWPELEERARSPTTPSTPARRSASGRADRRSLRPPRDRARRQPLAALPLVLAWEPPRGRGALPLARVQPPWSDRLPGLVPAQRPGRRGRAPGGARPPARLSRPQPRPAAAARMRRSTSTRCSTRWCAPTSRGGSIGRSRSRRGARCWGRAARRMPGASRACAGRAAPRRPRAICARCRSSVAGDPLINVVLALFDRDGGEERRARALLGSVAAAFPGTAVEAALAAPLERWPATLDEMIRLPRRDATVAGPRRAEVTRSPLQDPRPQKRGRALRPSLFVRRPPEGPASRRA